ncbi:hypothetical protein AB9H24_04360 [Micrococcus luteus]|uniref:hypothetical protein n=1 Tax=Micrococcus luteus TaxID=1270 RepID=UPI0035150CF6
MIVADLHFADRGVEALCSDEREATKKLGAPAAKKLRNRLKELQSTTDPDILKTGPGTWHDLHYDLDGHIAGKVSGGDRIVVRHTTDYATGRTVWCIVCIGDCYDH